MIAKLKLGSVGIRPMTINKGSVSLNYNSSLLTRSGDILYISNRYLLSVSFHGSEENVPRMIKGFSLSRNPCLSPLPFKLTQSSSRRSSCVPNDLSKQCQVVIIK
jgi:hypothetical protein